MDGSKKKNKILEQNKKKKGGGTKEWGVGGVGEKLK